MKEQLLDPKERGFWKYSGVMVLILIGKEGDGG